MEWRAPLVCFKFPIIQGIMIGKSRSLSFEIEKKHQTKTMAPPDISQFAMEAMPHLMKKNDLPIIKW